MFRSFRGAVMWLLVAAVPLQAFAAAGMSTCGVDHGLAGVPSMMHDRIATSPGGAMSAAHHQAHPMAGATTDTDHRHLNGSRSKSTASKCSVCASCCASVAIPPSHVVFDGPVQTEFFAPVVLVGLPTFLTAGPERPPRPFLA